MSIGLPTHIYVVGTRKRWPELETALTSASRSEVFASAIYSPFDLKTRGVGGANLTSSAPPQDISAPPGTVGQLIKGARGVLVVERWFLHTSAKTSK